MSYIFTILFLANSVIGDNLSNISCEPIKSYASCSFMPGCEFDTKNEKCIGTMPRLPRFFKEFRAAIDFKMSQKDVLSAYDLESLAFYRESLAQYINKNNITDPIVLNSPLIGVTTERRAEERQVENSFEEQFEDNPREYPSGVLLYAHREEIRRFSAENLISLDNLLRSEPEVVVSLAFDEDRVTSILNVLGLKLSDAARIKDNAVLNADLDSIKILMTKGKLTAEQILSIKDEQSSYFWQAAEFAQCLSGTQIPFEWYLKTDASAAWYAISGCKKIDSIAKIFDISPNSLPVSWEKISALANGDEKSFANLHQQLGLTLDYILEKNISRNDIGTIKKSMKIFDLPANQAVFVLPEWNKYSKKQADEISRKLETPFLELAQLSPKEILKPSLLAAHQVIRLHPKHLIEFNLTNLKHPKLFNEIYVLWQQNSTQKELSSYLAAEMKNISESPELMASFEADFKKFKEYGMFERFVYTYEKTVSPIYKSNVIFDKIIQGDLDSVKGLPFASDPALLFDERRGPALVFAKKLGYNDIAAYLEKLTPKTIRITVHKGRKVFELPTDRDPFLSTRDAWHLARIKQEPLQFTYLKDVGRLILEQSDFWDTSEIKDINLFNKYSVADSLEFYKGAGYVSMADFLKSAKNAPFPFASKGDLASQINAANYALLLAPKADKPVQVFRGQGCQKKWITDPNRFWSTSASVEFARNWAYNGCLLEVQIPKGYPLFFLNIASMVNAGEHEFLLPSHVLNKKGKLVLARYKIIEEEKKFIVAAQFDLEHDTEYQLNLEAKVYVVTPSEESMVFEEGKGQKFRDYEIKYNETICAPANLSLAKNHEYLIQMCDFAKKWDRKN